MTCRVAAIQALICAGLTVMLMAAPGVAFTARADDTPDSITLEIKELNGSGVHGMAVLTARGDQTLVALDVTGVAGEHPDHIHRSTCEDPEPNPLYPLTDVVLSEADPQGHSETVVDVSLDKLLADPHLILIHKSAQEINVYLACADIVANGVDVPNTGMGATAADRTGRAAWLVAAGAVALLAMAARFSLRRRVE